MDPRSFRIDADSPASPQRFAAFFEQAATAMVILDKLGNCVAVNDAWEKLHGTTRDALRGYNVFEDSRLLESGVLTFIRRALAGETAETPPVYMDPSLIGRPGRAAWLKIGYSPIRDARGEVAEIAVIVREVTAEIEAEERLAASVLRFRFLAEAMPQMAWLVGRDGKGEYVNKRWLDYCGIADRTEAQARWGEFVHPDDQARSFAAWTAARDNGTPFELEYRLRNAAGIHRWFLARCSPVRPGDRTDGPVLAWVGTATDINEQKEAAEVAKFWAAVSNSLNSSIHYQERLNELTKTVTKRFGGWCVIHARGEDGVVGPVAISHTDPAQEARAWESSRRLPVSPDTEIGVGWVLKHGRTQMIPVVTDELVQRAARDEAHLALLRQAKIRSYMCLPLRGPDGVIGTMMLLSADREFSPHELAMAEEVAARAGNALENARLYEVSARAVEARDNLLSVTSHELRTPVTSLKLQLQMARRSLKADKTPEPAVLSRQLDLSIKQVDRLNTLIEDLLNFSAVSAGKIRYQFSEVDVAALVRETMERHGEGARLSHTPLEQRGPEIFLAEVDPLRFGQIVENLVTNALKYGAGGTVSLTLEDRGPDWALVVQDRGIGIAPEKINRIFERYERVGPIEGISGFGLGLFVSQAFAEAHGGTIAVESEPGKGSTFSVVLPRKRPAVAD